MTFLECADCGESIRLLDHELRRDAALALELAEEAAAFSTRHEACRVVRWLPCDDATSDLSPLEPFARWAIPVRRAEDPSVRALARGFRPVADGPREWRIEIPTAGVPETGPLFPEESPGPVLPCESPEAPVGSLASTPREEPAPPPPFLHDRVPEGCGEQLALPFGNDTASRPTLVRPPEGVGPSPAPAAERRTLAG